MKSLDLIQKIQSVRPSAERLFGYSKHSAESIGKLYQFHTPTTVEFSQYELLTFTTNYLKEPIELFGGISMWNTIQESEDYIYFGEIDIDLLGIHKNDGSIKFLEYDNSDHIMSHVALNCETFLDVIWQMYEHMTNSIIGTTNPDECAYAKALWRASDEPKSLGFYQMITGCYH